jgi:hypothetical protein
MQLRDSRSKEMKKEQRMGGKWLEENGLRKMYGKRLFVQFSFFGGKTFQMNYSDKYEKNTKFFSSNQQLFWLGNE